MVALDLMEEKLEVILCIMEDWENEISTMLVVREFIDVFELITRLPLRRAIEL